MNATYLCTVLKLRKTGVHKNTMFINNEQAEFVYIIAIMLTAFTNQPYLALDHTRVNAQLNRRPIDRTVEATPGPKEAQGDQAEGCEVVILVAGAKEFGTPTKFREIRGAYSVPKTFPRY